MKLGLGVGPLGPPGGTKIVELAREAEALGFDTIWCPEIYGADCFTPLAWIGAHTSRINLGTSIMQISARTPASAAMHAVTLDYLSGGRLILGIGVSGPQVVEGWYGQKIEESQQEAQQDQGLQSEVDGRSCVRFPQS